MASFRVIVPRPNQLSVVVRLLERGRDYFFFVANSKFLLPQNLGKNFVAKHYAQSFGRGQSLCLVFAGVIRKFSSIVANGSPIMNIATNILFHHKKLTICEDMKFIVKQITAN